MELIGLGILAAAALLFLLMKLDFKKVLGYAVFWDVSLTLLLMYMFAGTFAGMIVAVVAGAIISIILYVAKETIGYKKLTLKGWKEFPNVDSQS